MTAGVYPGSAWLRVFTNTYMAAKVHQEHALCQVVHQGWHSCDGSSRPRITAGVHQDHTRLRGVQQTLQVCGDFAKTQHGCEGFNRTICCCWRFGNAAQGKLTRIRRGMCSSLRDCAVTRTWFHWGTALVYIAIVSPLSRPVQGEEWLCCVWHQQSTCVLLVSEVWQLIALC